MALAVAFAVAVAGQSHCVVVIAIAVLRCNECFENVSRAVKKALTVFSAEKPSEMAPTRKLQYYYNYLHRRRKIYLIALYIIILELWHRIINRSIWIHHWIGRRELQGAHKNLFLELRMEDPERYRM